MKDETRRQFVKKVAYAAPVIMTLAANPSLARSGSGGGGGIGHGGGSRPHGNNGVGNGQDPQPPGNPPINDGPGTKPGNPGNRPRGR